MVLVVFNAFLYIFLLFYARKTNPRVSMGNILLIVYTLVACACVITYSMDIHPFILRLWPFIYLFVTFILLSFPLSLKPVTIEQEISIKNINLAKLILVVMTIAAVINIYYSLNATVSLVVDDNISEIYSEKEGAQLSVNSLDWLCKNLLNYGCLPFYIIAFYFLSKDDHKNCFLAAISILCVFFSTFLMSLMRVLRWCMLHDVICALAGYVVFYYHIPQKRKKIINVFLTLGITILVLAFILIAVARFNKPGSEYDSNSSLIYYLGHSMLVFNYGITDSIDSFAWGKFIAGIPILSDLGTHNQGDFPTFIGNLYVDFGPILTIIICSFVGRIFNRKRHVKDLGEAYLLAFYFVFLFMGVFTHASGYGVSWLFMILIYILFKTMI